MRTVIRNLSLLAVFLFAAAPALQSQCPPMYVFTGEAADDGFGISVASAGDVNNDGYDDIIVGAYLNDASGSTAGRAYVFSGQNGDTLHVFTGETKGDWFGISVASAGDVNKDGYADLIVGAQFNSAGGHFVGRAYVFSGQNGVILHRFTGEIYSEQLGFSVASAGDVNNDGYADLIVGSPTPGANGEYSGWANVYSGMSGERLYRFTGESAGDRFGFSVASAGDINADGYDDIIVGAPHNDAIGSDAGRAYVFSGLEGATLKLMKGSSQLSRFGWSVASAGDVNNDSKADLVVGVFSNDQGHAYIFSGQHQDIIHFLTGEATSNMFGWSVASAGDVDNDGHTDLIFGAPGNDAGGYGAGRAYVLSGKNSDTLFVFTGEAGSDAFGYSVSSAGDVNKDGYPDFIIGANRNDAGGTNAGRAYVYSGEPCCCFDVTGNIDCDANDNIDIADLTTLIDHLFIARNPLCCLFEANIDGDPTSKIDITDVTFLIDHLFISLLPIADCLE